MAEKSAIEKAAVTVYRIGDTWRFPKWDKDDNDQWLFHQDGSLVGEVYRTENCIKWHCMTSDWRDTNAETMEQAAAECEASFWEEEWRRLRDAVRVTLNV